MNMFGKMITGMQNPKLTISSYIVKVYNITYPSSK